jgi:hypothetical protein
MRIQVIRLTHSIANGLTHKLENQGDSGADEVVFVFLDLDYLEKT